MGPSNGCCGKRDENLALMPDQLRYRVFFLKDQEPYLADLQTKKFQAIKLAKSLPVSELKPIAAHPIIYFFGGRSTKTKEILKVGFKGDINLNPKKIFLSRVKDQKVAQGSPWLMLASNPKYIYAIGGVDTDINNIKVCQRYSLALDSWEELPPMNDCEDCAFEAGKSLYAFNYIVKDKMIEKLELTEPIKSQVWNSYSIKISIVRALDMVGCATINEESVLIFGGVVRSEEDMIDKTEGYVLSLKSFEATLVPGMNVGGRYHAQSVVYNGYCVNLPEGGAKIVQIDLKTNYVKSLEPRDGGDISCVPGPSCERLEEKFE